LGGAGLIATPDPTEPAVEQQFDDEAAVGMTDQHGRVVECADLRLVVIDDLGQAETLDPLGVFALRLDAFLLARPLARRNLVAPALEVLGERLPTPGVSQAP
jgi:hypothetical protein